MKVMNSRYMDMDRGDIFLDVDKGPKNDFPRILLVEDVVSTIQHVNLVFLELGCLWDLKRDGLWSKKKYFKSAECVPKYLINFF